MKVTIESVRIDSEDGSPARVVTAEQAKQEQTLLNTLFPENVPGLRYLGLDKLHADPVTPPSDGVVAFPIVDSLPATAPLPPTKATTS